MSAEDPISHPESKAYDHRTTEDFGSNDLHTGTLTVAPAVESSTDDSPADHSMAGDLHVENSHVIAATSDPGFVPAIDPVTAHVAAAPARADIGRVSRASRISRPVVSVDSSVDAILHPMRHPRAVRAVEMFSHLGDGGAIWLATLATFSRKDPAAALRAALVLAAGTVIVNGPVKYATKRPRPEPLDASAYRPSGSSFPSGHSFSSWLVASMLPTAHPLRIPAAVVASGISSSRVFLRYHHASDVVAGAVLGAVAGSLLRRVVRWR